jgi:SPP1 family predicted phage head-tail adaptor
MSYSTFARLLDRTFVVKAMTPALDENDDPILDEYSQPTTVETTVVAALAGRIRPTSAREVTAADQSGAVIGDFVAYCLPNALVTNECWLELDGTRYDILAVRDPGGRHNHLELDCRRVD